MSFVKTAHEIADELGSHADEVADDAKKVANQARGGQYRRSRRSS